MLIDEEYEVDGLLEPVDGDGDGGDSVDLNSGGKDTR